MIDVIDMMYLSVYAPPATVLRHDLHFQTPTAVRLTQSLPQNEHVNLALAVISNYLAISSI
jgi:hypothetical protein